MSSGTPAATDQSSRMSSLREAVGQARESIAQDDAKTTGAADTGTEETPPTEEASTPAETAEEFIENATAEEIAAIKADPVMSKLYNSMLKDYKTKTAAAAARAREADEREEALEQEAEQFKNARTLFDAIREDPKSVIRALAERNGLTIAEAKAAVEQVDDELTQMFGEDAPAVKPLFDRAVEKRAKAVVDASLGPIVQQLNEQAENNMRQDIASDIKAFQAELKAAGEEVTPDVEKEMIRLVDKLDQGEDLSTRDYIKMLYRLATPEKTKAQVTREVTDRMAKAVKGREPAEVASTAATSGTAALDPKLSFRESLAVARQEVRRGR